MRAHKKGKGSKYVSAKKFGKLLRAKVCKNRSEASKNEYEIKQLPKNKKLEWFNNHLE